VDTAAPATAQSVNIFADAIARFLAFTPSLNPASVGEYLSGAEKVPARAAYYFMRLLDLGNRHIASALKELFTALALPKEGQRIERIMEAFSNAYYDTNCDRGLPPHVFPFKNRDATFVLVVATVMLHTDLHNPRVSSKMNKNAFSLQLSRCNDNEDFPAGFAADLFDAIAAAPFHSAKGIGAVGTESAGPNSTQVASQGRMDFFFFSRDERRELLFSLERRRMLSETRELITRKTVPLQQTPATRWWCRSIPYKVEAAGAGPDGAADADALDDTFLRLPPLHRQGYMVEHLSIPLLLAPTDTDTEGGFVTCTAVARDLFNSTWGSLFAVFSLLLQQPEHVALGINGGGGSSSAIGVTEPVAPTALRNCVKGLQDLLYAAAAFGCQTEAEAAMTALLRVPKSSSVRRFALDAVFFVASSPFAANLSTNCWINVVLMCAEAHEAMAGGGAPGISPNQTPNLGGMTPANLSMASGCVAVYTSIEAALRLAPIAVPANKYHKALADTVTQAVTTALFNATHSDLAKLTGLLSVVRNVLRAFAAADIANAIQAGTRGTCSHEHLAGALDAMTGLFVSLLRVHAGLDNAVATITNCLEDGICLLIGVESELDSIQKHCHSPTRPTAKVGDDTHPTLLVFSLVTETYRSVQASQPTAAAGSSNSAAGGGMVANAIRVRIAVIRTLQSVLAKCRLPLRPLADAAGASLMQRSPLDLICIPSLPRHGTYVVSSRVHLNMIGAVLLDAVATPGSGLAAELRTMASMALSELLTLGAAVAGLPLAEDPPRPGTPRTPGAGAVSASETVLFNRSQALDAPAKTGEADEHAKRQSDILSSLLPLAFLCSFFSAEFTVQGHCVGHATTFAHRALGIIIKPPHGAASDGFDGDGGRHDLVEALVSGYALALGSASPDTRSLVLTSLQWVVSSCVPSIRMQAAQSFSGSMSISMSSPLAPSVPPRPSRAGAALEALASRISRFTARGMTVPDVRANVDRLVNCALLEVSPTFIAQALTNVTTAGILRNSNTFAQLMVFVSCDLFGAPSGPRRDAAATKGAMHAPLPWQTAQQLATCVVHDCIMPLLDPKHSSGDAASVMCQSLAAKCLVRVLDRSLTAFGSSPSAHDATGLREETEYVLAAIASAIEIVRLPPSFLQAFVKTPSTRKALRKWRT
jgi:hypothetical protein